MGVAASGGRVGEHLESLEERFGPFSVDQTTIAATPTDYQRALERAEAGVLDAVVRVWNDEDLVLQVGGPEEWDLPRQHGVDVTDVEDAIEELLAREFDVACTIDGLEHVTITGIRNEDEEEADAVYRLFAVVDATHASGDPVGAEWRTFDPHGFVATPL